MIIIALETYYKETFRLCVDAIATGITEQTNNRRSPYPIEHLYGEKQAEYYSLLDAHPVIVDQLRVVTNYQSDASACERVDDGLVATLGEKPQPVKYADGREGLLLIKVRGISCFMRNGERMFVAHVNTTQLTI